MLTAQPASFQSTNLLGDALGGHRSCALLDYPDHLNIGDHLIWLSTLLLLMRSEISVGYCASLVNFSADEMEQRVGMGPVLLQGGGNVGDLWPDSQLFRERVISLYQDRPIVILPQSVYFSDAARAQRAAKIFNAHPNLTLFARESASFEVATELFPNCRVVKAPDMALFFDRSLFPARTGCGADLSNHPGHTAKPVLYLCRRDAELRDDFSPNKLGLKDIVVEDWRTYSWAYTGRGKTRSFNEWYWQFPGSIWLYRELWQRGLADPRGWLSRLNWDNRHPTSDKLARLPGADLHRFSWSLMHEGMRQIARCRLLVTNRLHGQLLASLLGIPSILVPNAYHKNESFFNTWMQAVPQCHFAATPQQLRDSIHDMLGAH